MRSAERGRATVAAWVPRWWAGQGGRAAGALDTLLAPVEAAYRGVVGARSRGYAAGWIRQEAASIPVVSVGNLAVGGAGKTPVAAHVAERLVAVGGRPAVVLRGYGRDEPLVHRILNPEVPVFTDAVRLRAVERAAALGCDVAVLDDGFQHRRLVRELDLLLIAADGWVPAMRLLPRGPWREPLSAARRADLLLITSKSAGRAEVESVRRAVRAVAPELPVAVCRLEPAALMDLHGSGTVPLHALGGTRVLAVAALAAPAPFVANLEAFGADVELAAFADHHDYTSADAADLVVRARGRPIVTTLKDAVKLRERLDPAVQALVLHQRVRVEEGGFELDRALGRLVAGADG